MRDPVLRLAVALVAFAVFAHASTARAEDDESLEYVVDARAKNCPTAAEFREEVARQIGGDEAGVRRAGMPRVAVHIEPDGQGLRARIDVEAESRRSQTLRAPAYACRDLSSAAAIAVSLVFRAYAPEPEPEPEPAPAPVLVQPAPRAEQNSKPPPARAAATQLPIPHLSKRHWRLRHALYASAVVGQTAVPDLGIGTAVGYAATWSRPRTRLGFGFTVEADMFLPQTAHASRGGGVFAYARMASVAPCLYWGVLLGCASGTIGSTVGKGTDVRDSERRELVHSEVGLRLGARIPLAPPFALRVELRGGIPLVDSRFVIESDTVWRTPTVTALGAVGLETTF